ncbi:MAG: TatD family hydrolase [bacterium]|nr:TatD family hydrolase [bacterium]
MLFDSHCHYNLEPIYANWHKHWQKAQASGVAGAMVVGADLPSSVLAVKLTNVHPEFKACIGIHPTEYQEFFERPTSPTLEQGLAELDSQMTELETLLSRNRISAIGETGLDFYRLDSNSSMADSVKKLQHAAFIRHLKLAALYSLPTIIHVRDTGLDAYNEILQLLEENLAPSQTFVLHCISGTASYLDKALKLGAFIGVAGNVTYKNADNIRSLVRMVPKDRLLLETDAPFLAPHPHRGSPCDPWMISLTAEYLTEEMGINEEQIYQNTQKVFKL